MKQKRLQTWLIALLLVIILGFSKDNIYAKTKYEEILSFQEGKAIVSI